MPPKYRTQPALLINAPAAITRCSICDEPAHASETDDLDRHPACRDGADPRTQKFRHEVAAGLGATDDWASTWAWAKDVWGPDPTYSMNQFFRGVAAQRARAEGFDEVGSSDVRHLTIDSVRAARAAGVTTRTKLTGFIFDYYGYGNDSLGAARGAARGASHLYAEDGFRNMRQTLAAAHNLPQYVYDFTWDDQESQGVYVRGPAGEPILIEYAIRELEDPSADFWWEQYQLLAEYDLPAGALPPSTGLITPGHDDAVLTGSAAHKAWAQYVQLRRTGNAVPTAGGLGATTTRPVSELLSEGFDAGNYANAYESTDLDDFEDKLEGRANAYVGGFVLGFYSSYAPHEINDDRYDDARRKYGRLARQHGFID